MRVQHIAVLVLIAAAACNSSGGPSEQAESQPGDAFATVESTTSTDQRTPTIPETTTAIPPTPSTRTSTASSTTQSTAAPSQPETTRRVSLIGDGVAFGLNEALVPALRWFGVDARGAALPGCGIATGLAVDRNGDPYPQSEICLDGTGRLHEEIRDDFRPTTVVWLSTWEMHDRLEGREHLSYGTAAHDEALAADLAATAARFTDAGIEVVVLSVVPPPPGTIYATDDSDERYAHYNSLLADLAAAEELVRIVDLGAVLCPDGPPCPRVLDGVEPRPDGLHVSGDGARWIAPQLISQIVSPD